MALFDWTCTASNAAPTCTGNKTAWNENGKEISVDILAKIPDNIYGPKIAAQLIALPISLKFYAFTRRAIGLPRLHGSRCNNKC